MWPKPQLWQVNYKLNQENSDISGRLYKKLNINVNIGDIHLLFKWRSLRVSKSADRGETGWMDGFKQTPEKP